MVVLLSTILGIWLVLTVVRQLEGCQWRWSQRVSRSIRRYDPFRLVPSFSFFAPNPPPFDFELLYRDRLEDGSITAWRALAPSSSSLRRAVWNPEKRRCEVVLRLCAALVQEATRQLGAHPRVEELYLSRAYVALATYTAAAPHSVVSDATQFLIAVSPGFDVKKEAAIAFVSPFFRL